MNLMIEHDLAQELLTSFKDCNHYYKQCYHFVYKYLFFVNLVTSYVRKTKLHYFWFCDLLYIDPL